MVRRTLEIDLSPTVPPGGSWIAMGPEGAERTLGGVHSPAESWEDRLPRRARHLAPRLEALQELLDGQLEPFEALDAIDVTALWRDEQARLTYLAEIEAIEHELVQTLGTRWVVRVSREPAVRGVQMMGEYGCDWPLWGPIGSDREDWPMLSDALAVRLAAWARIAEPDSGRRNPPDVTDRLLRDLRRELGPTFEVSVEE